MIGWIQLSRKAVANAEQALRDDQQGVRDEIGFLSLHQSLADRLFPGTSVLHTRLRYVLFVPWLMLHSNGDAARLRNDLRELTRQLKRADDEWGIIGGSIWPREPSQTPAMAYWSALARWNILQSRFDGAVPTRSQVLQRIATSRRGASSQLNIDGELIHAADVSPFVELPAPPEDFLKPGKTLDFSLTRAEHDFLRGRLIAVRRGVDPDGQSLLGCLAERRFPLGRIQVPWHAAVRRVADAEDRKILDLAKHAAAFACIGRGVYAALVERAKNADTGARESQFRDHLIAIRSEYQADALALDLTALQRAIPELTESLLSVMRETLDWLTSRRVDCSNLQEIYRQAEVDRKGSRARLGPTLGAKRRRAEWNTDQARHPLAEPLHYRWNQVKNLLGDLLAT